jgi:N-glycosylase/DNA lyase
MLHLLYCTLFFAFLQSICLHFYMQQVLGVIDGEVRELLLPDCNELVVPGVRWGAFDQFFTPAYWVSQLWMLSDTPSALTYRLGRTLKEETAACMLGGHGITAEMCLAAYDALRESGILQSSTVTQAEIASVLKQRLSSGNRSFHYRFPNIKAKFLAPALNALHDESPPTEDHKAFRNWFLRFAGVGLKTASWITRNWLNSDDVAILDVHVVRCGRMCGLFQQEHDPARHYCEMEERFLHFASCLGVHAAKLDVLMWQQMRTAGPIGIQAFQNAA